MFKVTVIVALLIVAVSGFPARMIDVADLETVRILGNQDQANVDPTVADKGLIYLDSEDEEVKTSEGLANHEYLNPDWESDGSFESRDNDDLEDDDTDNDDLEDDDTEVGLRGKRSMDWHMAQPSKDFDEGAVKIRWRWNDGTPESKPRKVDVFDGLNAKQSDSAQINAPLVHYRRLCKSRFERRDRHGVCRSVID
ncbi:uncharacterized protein LOC124302352 [Neodiprion virginianus]|uniref:uncharacterized protein LOC124302352 n=1 Tax=Neodiprion virginianus TaxID=2961670 RepID=UPI001EE75BDC|nr:uncharacterized protein LOC124302352 [Neodiprion virginianus]